MKLLLLPFFIFYSLSCFSQEFIKGVCVHPQFYSEPSSLYLAAIDKYGFDSIRTDYYWRDIEKKPGVYSKDNMVDVYIDHMLSKKGGSVVLVLGGVNPIYGNTPPVTQEQFDAYIRYVSWVATHFKGKKIIYEIWNEWNKEKNIKNPTGFNSSESYVALIKKSSSVIRKIDSSATIIAGSMNPNDSNDIKWTMKLVKLGVLNYIDGVSIHPYAYNLGADENFERVEYFLNLISSYNSNMNIYVTEIGIPTLVNNRSAFFSEKSVSEYYKLFISLASKNSKIKGVWWYDLADDGMNINDKEHNFGIVDFSLKEKALARELLISK
ncbi:hypothetical protein [Klebsiella quasipneumoniae]|uniref:hypothetical protein n=1 Tax=Klebsiella quasipneumoniae TaxID=1463165 RepID=UPI0012EB75EE|nr:hypothetical protein [Klebsiella quasipneumoniae]